MSEQPAPQTEAAPPPQAAQEARPTATPPLFADWFAPQTPAQRREPGEIMSEVVLKPMEPMKPAVDIGEAIARSMGPGPDMSPRLEAPLLDVGDVQHQNAPMFRRGQAQGYNGMSCPFGMIGNCIYCQRMPCNVLKAKVLEVVAAEYRLALGQPLKPT